MTTLLTSILTSLFTAIPAAAFNSISLLVAGVWSMVWHWTILVVLLTLCLSIAWHGARTAADFWYSVFLASLAAVLNFAILIVVALSFHMIGVHDEKVHRDAAEKVLIQQIHDAVKNALENGGKDPYDEPRS